MKRMRISDNQSETLDNFYERGMVGTGTNYREMIGNATLKTGLTTMQVQKWIGNQKRKRPVDSVQARITEDDAQLKKAKAVRGPTAYNLFCGDFFKADDCKELPREEKNKLASAAWLTKSTGEKDQYQKTADDMKLVKVNELSEEQKNKLIKRHRKKLLDEILILEDLGCEVATMLQDNSGEMYHLGTQHGTMFLASYPDIGVKFREYFCNDSQIYSINDVQNLFNKKYSEAVGKPSRVPYLKGGYKVEGLPDGIPFRKPYHYGALQCKKIMLEAEKIKFTVDQSLCLEKSGNLPVMEVTSNMEPVRQLLTKIAGSHAAERASTDPPTKIEESDVEVINLVVSEEEKILLYSTCNSLFTDDAWLAVGQNMKHCQDDKNLVLPIYTEADERFWLFHTVSKPLNIHNSEALTKVEGYWMDLKPEGNYVMLFSKKIVLLGKNIVRTLHGPLYFIVDENLGQNSSYDLPILNRQAILNALGLLN